jgi:hypothetical protein
MVEGRDRVAPRSIADILTAVARELLVAPEPPWRLPTVRELASRHRSSPSSISGAIRHLREAGAVQVESRGRLGAVMTGRSISALWQIAENGPLVIALPLASSSRYEALATALKQILSQAGIEVFLIFVRGSRQRLQAVRERRCNLAVMSSFAASELCGREDSVVTQLLPDSYNTGHRVLYSSSMTNGKPLRVIVDRFSADQQLLTALEFSGPDIQLVPAMSGQIARMLVDGSADAAIWTTDEMQVNRPRGVSDRPLSPAVLERVGVRETIAVLVGRAVESAVLNAITAVLVPTEVERIQRDVVEGRIVPEY